MTPLSLLEPACAYASDGLLVLPLHYPNSRNECSCGALSCRSWTVIAGDGEADSSSWRHPTATSNVSATIRHDFLFAYSPNTGLAVSGDSHEYTKFHAWHELNGMTGSEAAKAAYKMMKDAA